MEKRHILLCGERGVGKSTLICRLLESTSLPVSGFVTKRESVADENGFFPIYLHPAEQNVRDRQFEKANLVGICDSRSSVRHSEVFDTLGVQLIERADSGILLMDELGFLESEAYGFQKAVLAALDRRIPVIAAVKPKETQFLCAVRQHPDAELIYITRENRDGLFEELLPWIQKLSE